MEVGEFHWTDGWYFKRNADGSVRIRKKAASSDDAPVIAEATIPALEWVSVASHCTQGGEAQNYEILRRLVTEPAELGDLVREVQTLKSLLRSMSADAEKARSVLASAAVLPSWAK